MKFIIFHILMFITTSKLSETSDFHFKYGASSLLLNCP